jgi:adenylate cyclase class 2
MLWEVEQKFRITDVQAAEAKLAQLGAHFADSIQQIDHYFNHPARDFGQTDEALRLRQVGSQNFITYKGPRVDATTKTRRELELPLPPGQPALDQFTSLLKALGFRPVGTVRKQRRKASLDWEGRSVEAALDDVEGLGSFLELEISAEDAALQPAKQSLQSLAQRLEAENSERKSYLELLLEKHT